MTFSDNFMYLRRAVTRLKSCNDGAIAMFVGLTLFVVLGTIGFGFDYARSIQEKAELQAAGDAAAIAAARQRFFDTSQSKMQDAADAAFALNYKGKFKNQTPLMTVDNGTVSIVLTGSVQTTILGAVGVSKFDVETESIARIPNAIDAEIVFVLDYSSSMNSAGKYDAMRDAAIQLINDLSGNKKSADQNLRFGLVPFATYVYGELPKAHVIGEDPVMSTIETCFDDRPYPANIDDTTPVATNDATRWAKGVPVSYDATPCDTMESRDLEILPLTNDTNKVIDQLQSMTPHEGTNISMGFQMGWHVISPNLPFNNGVQYNDPITRKFIILLSDGRQTIDGNGPNGTSSEAAAEVNLETMCTAIAAKGVNVVTVAFDLQDQATTDRLRNCASKPGYFFDADSNSDLGQSFVEITTLLADNLRLLK